MQQKQKSLSRYTQPKAGRGARFPFVTLLRSRITADPLEQRSGCQPKRGRNPDDGGEAGVAFGSLEAAYLARVHARLIGERLL